MDSSELPNSTKETLGPSSVIIGRSMLIDHFVEGEDLYEEEESSVGDESKEKIAIYELTLDRLPDWYAKINSLPEGYGYSGGVARSLMLEVLGEKSPHPRDLDVVAVKSLNPDISLRDDISWRYMPDDTKRGHGVKIETNVADYMSERDFTINEVLAIGNRLFFSERALVDLEHKIIRPTGFEMYKWESYVSDEWGINPRLAMKALVLQAEFLKLYGKGSVEDIEEWQWDIEGKPPFELALGIEKAAQKGVGLRFYLSILDKGNIKRENLPSGVTLDSLRELAHYVRKTMLRGGREPFEFSENVFNDEEQQLDRIYEHYADLANAYASSGKIKNLNSREKIEY